VKERGQDLKVLLITGVLAEDIVKGYAKESKIETTVLALKVPVAAFLTPQTIVGALKTEKTGGFDIILVPGLIRGDTTVISNTVNIPTFKGPRYAADLPTVLDSLGEVALSTVTPACDLLKEKLMQRALQELSKVEQNRDTLLKNPGSMLIKNLAIGKDFPMRIMAEIVDAALMESTEIQRMAKHYVQLGADIIDLGMIVGENRPEDAKRIVKAVKMVVDIPVSIDTLNPVEIKEAVAAGADLILSADAGNIENIAAFAQNVAVVVIPTNQREGYFPKNATERVRFLEQIIQNARQLGMQKILGDLILEPSNVLESFIAFQEFAKRNPDVPLFVGVSNVTELIDADSIGVNAILARLSSEVDASVILATEKSDKSRGTVSEEVAAAKMMFLAKRRGSVPKDLGINLLVLKDKRNREEPYDQKLEDSIPVLIGSENSDPAVLDEKGSFRIFVDRVGEAIVVLHYPSSMLDQPTEVIKGKTAQSVLAKILEMGFVSRMDHAGYLGAELSKAEVALRIGKEYIQEKGLFNK
jgi:dihydropteroate synthase-like protein